MRKGLIFTALLLIVLMLTGLVNLNLNIQNAEADVSFFDDFNTTTLSSSYSVIDPAGSSNFSLTANPGYLRITSPANRDLWRINSNYDAPRIEQEAISGDFIVETKVSALWTEKYECSGIYIWKDQNNFMRLERFYGNPGERVSFEAIRNGQTDKFYLYNIELNPIYLKIVRSGDLITGFCSGDGINWTICSNYTFSVSGSLSVGLYVVNMERSGNFYADFDYFKIENAIIQPALSPTSPFPTPSPAYSVQSGLVCYWKFDEGSGIVTKDSSGNGYNGKIFGASWTPGKFSYALDFNGISDYVSIPWLPLSSLTSFSVVAWVNSTFDKVGNIVYSGVGGEFLLHNGEIINYGSASAYISHLNSSIFSVKLAGSWFSVYSQPLEPNSWYQIVGIWEKGTSMRIFVNGVLSDEVKTIPDAYLNSMAGLNYPSDIGAYSQEAGAGISQGETLFKGKIDNVMVYNRTLDVQEITNLYHGLLPNQVNPSSSPSLNSTSIPPETTNSPNSLPSSLPAEVVSLPPSLSPTTSPSAYSTTQQTQSATANSIQGNLLILLLLVAVVAVPLFVLGFWLLFRKLKFAEAKTEIAGLIEKNGRIGLKETSEKTSIKAAKLKKTILNITKEEPLTKGFFIDNDREFITQSTTASLLNSFGKFSVEELSKKFNITKENAKDIVAKLHNEGKIKGTFTVNGDGYITEEKLMDEIGK